MRIILIFIFLISNSFILFNDNKAYFEVTPNAKSEALGGTGMIYGEEYGTFYLAPTSLHKKGINILGVISFYKPREDYTNKGSIFLKTKVGSFSGGYCFESLNISFISVYSFDISNFSFGFGLIYNNEPSVFQKGGTKYLLANTNAMYKSILGSFSLALNNNLLKVFSDSENIFRDNNSLKADLRIGYGKEFKMTYLFDSIKLSLEINNLLMNNFYINKEEKNYNFYNKLHFGIEIIKNIEEINFALRLGIKNFFPTVGLGLEIFDGLRIEWAFTNKQWQDNKSDKKELINFFSFELRPNNIIYEKIKMHKNQ